MKEIMLYNFKGEELETLRTALVLCSDTENRITIPGDNNKQYQALLPALVGGYMHDVLEDAEEVSVSAVVDSVDAGYLLFRKNNEPTSTAVPMWFFSRIQ